MLHLSKKWPQIQKHWKIRQVQATATATINDYSEPFGQRKNTQLYLQNNPELIVEQYAFETQLETRLYNLMASNQHQEMPEEGTLSPWISSGERHGLRGEERARELHDSPIHQDCHRYSFDEPHLTDFNKSVLTLHEFQ